jgi:hypothetical protein
MQKLCLTEDCDMRHVGGGESDLLTSFDQHQTLPNASTLSIISKGTKSMGQTPKNLVWPHLRGPAALTY